MKITALIENTANDNRLECEHGLSLYIETEKHKILFDTGQTDMLVRNAKKLGIDLSQVDTAVVSHGHYDHTGGLHSFLEINKTAPVYLSRYAFSAYYNGTEKYIGMDTKLKSCPRFIFTDDYAKITDSLTLYSCNKEKKHFNLGSFGLTVKQSENFLPDDFRHEQYLLIEENNKRVLISGCSHKGILNIAKWFEADFLIGGFHFSKLPLDEKLREYALYLDSFPTVYHTCHCTGKEQFEFMKKHMSRLQYLSTGQTIEI